MVVVSGGGKDSVVDCSMDGVRRTLQFLRKTLLIFDILVCGVVSSPRGIQSGVSKGMSTYFTFICTHFYMWYHTRVPCVRYYNSFFMSVYG
jgi:hypothetical protein